MGQDSIAQIITEIQSGSKDAAEKLYKEYQPLVIRVIRRHLRRDLRRLADSIDFAQAVWKTLFEHASHLEGLGSREVVAAYVAQVAANKVTSDARAQLSQKRDIRRTTSNSASDSVYMPARDPTPSQVAIVKEHFETLASGLNSVQKEMVEQKLAGYTLDEIAANLGVNERTIRRVMKRLHPPSQ